ncbi:MAG: chorismate lyase [Gammaproteobacteria bacterium]|nr:chorismate lyase [Gammaproteobacteria bacterium]
MNNTLLLSLNDNERSWLMSSESLTKRLREFTHNKITHHLFYDNWGTTDDISIAALSIDRHTKTWIRHMEWRLEDTILVACSVVIPETSITAHTQELLHVEKKSIGDILFQDKTLSRSDFTFYKNAENNWTRFSIFYFKKQPLLITENFLPAFFKKISTEASA